MRYEGRSVFAQSASERSNTYSPFVIKAPASALIPTAGHLLSYALALKKRALPNVVSRVRAGAALGPSLASVRQWACICVCVFARVFVCFVVSFCSFLRVWLRRRVLVWCWLLLGALLLG